MFKVSFIYSHGTYRLLYVGLLTCNISQGRGFPTLIAYMDGEEVGIYHGSRTVQDMKQYVYELVNGYRQKSQVGNL